MNNKKRSKERFIMSVSLVGIVVATACTQLLGPISIAAPTTIFKTPDNFQAPPPPSPPTNTNNSNITEPRAINQGGIEVAKEVEESFKAFVYQTPDLNPEVLKLSLRAYYNAKNRGYTTNPYLTVIDYSMPSTTKRMWVLDLATKSMLYNTYVAHGKASGDNYAHKFSNRHGSLMSSLGLFKTGGMYQGHYGDSLVLHGLEERFNSNALERKIVVHAASYVDEKIIKQIGRLGRSFGCLALNQKIAKKIMQTIKNGSLVFCYYPDKDWLQNSKILEINKQPK